MKKYGDAITNQGKGFPFVDRNLIQDDNLKEWKLTITILQAPFNCRVEMCIEKELANELGVGIPKGFKQIINKDEIEYVSEEIVKPNEPYDIVIPVENLKPNFGQVTISLPFKFELGGGSLNANAPIGLANQNELLKIIEQWKRNKESWEYHWKEYEKKQR